jgi:hypothetical protein
MAQEFLAETFVWQPGLKKKEYRFDTLDAAKAFADEEAAHYHVIKVWNEAGKNVYTKRTLRTQAEDPDGSHTSYLLAAQGFAQKGELNPRTITNAQVLAATLAQAPNLSGPEPMANVLPMPPEPNLDVPLAPGGEQVVPPETMPE